VRVFRPLDCHPWTTLLAFSRTSGLLPILGPRCWPFPERLGQGGHVRVREYARTFAENDIDFSLLHDLTDQHLKDLGVSSLGHRLKMLRAIGELAGTPGGPGSAPSRPEACSSRNRRAPPAHRDVLRRCGLHRVIRQARPRRPPSRAIHAGFAWTMPTLVDESLSLTLSGPFSRPNRQYRPHGCVSRPPRKEARSMAYW
jgi:SAM domain (Sterile alpha motif)